MIKKIHVNQHNIRENYKDGGKRPPITVRLNNTEHIHCHRVELLEPSEVVYPKDRIPYGARVWIQTEGKVKAYDQNDKLIEEL